MTKIRLGNKDIYYQVFYKKIKHMYLRVRENSIIISCPMHTSKAKIEAFIFKNSDNVVKRLWQCEQKKPLYSKTEFLYFGENLQLEYQLDCKKNDYMIKDSMMFITFQANVFDQSFIEDIYHQEVHRQIQRLVDEVKTNLDGHFNLENITYKTQLMKSRYGSCIPKKRIIKINTLLGRFDLLYLKSVLIHELIHLEVPNHQKAFYALMETYVPHYREQMKTLNHLTRKYVF